MSSPESPRDRDRPFPKAPDYEYARGPADSGRPSRPREVDWATVLLLVTAVLGLITTAFQLADKSGMLQAIREAQPSWSEQQVRDSYYTARKFSIALCLVLFVLYVLLVLQLQRGRNWARILVTVLLAIGVIGGLASVSQPATAANKTLGGLGLVIDIAVLILLYRRPAADYFRSRWAATFR